MAEWQHQQPEVLSVFIACYIPIQKRGQICQQEGAPSHNSASTSRFLKVKVKVLQDCVCPAQSPHMNTLEQVWGKMKEEAWIMRPKNLNELWESCKTVLLPFQMTEFFESLLKHEVLQTHGSQTQYFFFPKAP